MSQADPGKSTGLDWRRNMAPGTFGLKKPHIISGAEPVKIGARPAMVQGPLGKVIPDGQSSPGRAAFCHPQNDLKTE